MATRGSHPPPGDGDVPRVVEHLFRHEAGKIVATLTRVFGFEHLDLAQDVVQEALIRALQSWPYYGIPDNPAAWIMRVSRNLALDFVRRDKVFRDKAAEIARRMDRQHPARADDTLRQADLQDDRLLLLFACCHPLLPAEMQVALALRHLCGFSVTEIARAFLTSEAAIAKRLARAKQKLREARVAFELPEPGELPQRLDGVWQTLYLLFNEGYKASSGEQLVRHELCREAIRLASLLVEQPAGNLPGTRALLALMLLDAARLPAREDAEGNLLRLKEQDRSRWDRTLIARGMLHLAQSAAGDELTRFHLEAGIAACHCAAGDYASTDWRRILSLYDRLIELDGSPVVALHRAVAVAHVHGPEAGLQALAPVREREELRSYYLFYAVLGEFEARLDRPQAAAGNFRRSRDLAALAPERRFLAQRLRDVQV